MPKAINTEDHSLGKTLMYSSLCFFIALSFEYKTRKRRLNCYIVTNVFSISQNLVLISRTRML